MCDMTNDELQFYGCFRNMSLVLLHTCNSTRVLAASLSLQCRQTILRPTEVS